MYYASIKISKTMYRFYKSGKGNGFRGFGGRWVPFVLKINKFTLNFVLRI